MAHGSGSPFLRIIESARAAAAAAAEVAAKLRASKCANCGAEVQQRPRRPVTDKKTLLCVRCGNALADAGARILADAAESGLSEVFRGVLTPKR